jgi:minor extracellular serine protease Vpr
MNNADRTERVNNGRHARLRATRHHAKGSMLVHRAILILAAWLGSFQPVAAQSLKAEEFEKLHPRFRTLLALDDPQRRQSETWGVSPLRTVGGELLYGAIVYTTNADALRAEGFPVNSVMRDFVTVKATLSDLARIAQHASVRYIDFPSVAYPTTDISVPETGAYLVHAGLVNGTPYKGSGVIVAIYDTGIDWRHRDFRDPSDTTKSRILAIWDHTLTQTLSGESPPAGFSYGVEYKKAQIENELDGTPAGFVRSTDGNGHGTHVAGIAAGNGSAVGGKYRGVAPEADLIIVKGGDGSFSTVSQIDAITYLAKKADSLGKPIVLNMSIGGHFGPHDGTSSVEVTIDDFVSKQGRAVVVSAGNDGSNPISFSGTVVQGQTTEVRIRVPTYAQAGSNNNLFLVDVWFRGGHPVTATLISPNNVSFTVPPGASGPGSNNSDGTIVMQNLTSEHIAEGDRNVAALVSEANGNVLASGGWRLLFTNSSSAMSFDGWLVRRSLGSGPQSVTVDGATTEKTVAMPGTAKGAITVASHVTRFSWPAITGSQLIFTGQTNRIANISLFSSKGPTRDERVKPDLSAPGENIGAAHSTASSGAILVGGKHKVLAGTSMAAPHVAGAVGLLLEANPSLSASQIKDLLTASTERDGFTGMAIPNFIWGYGKLDIYEAMQKVVSGSGVSSTKTVLQYDNPSSGNRVIALSKARHAGVRFTPTVDGRMTALQLDVTTQNNTPIVGAGLVTVGVHRSDNGVPGALVGTALNHPLSLLNPGTNNYIDLTSAYLPVEANTDYIVVLSLSNAADTLKVRTDDGSKPSGRSLVLSAGGWVEFSHPNSGLADSLLQTNLRLRAVVTSLSGIPTVARLEGVPRTFALMQNYPNPFNPSTTIRYSIPADGHVSLKVFDIMGREVAILVDERQPSGSYQTRWNGAARDGLRAASGVYFFRLVSGEFVKSHKMMLLR